MSSSHNNKSKGNIKSVKEIKKEPVELKSLDSYVDDRVELIKQTFHCLKPKTIKSFAPDFLQEKPLEAIQAYCLDEILGISKKRLLSIIRATKCPSDTETSNSENDEDDLHPTNNIIEHISLDEISSDSDDNLTNKNKKSEKQNGKPEENIEGKKEFSVLELLELQARARAIRSQLALEPVTKIELDSDKDDTDSNTSNTRKRKLNDALSTANDSGINENRNLNENSIKVEEPPKRVRLKRNFRKRQLSNEDEDDDNINNENSENLAIETNKSNENVKIENTENVDTTSNSPVITNHQPKAASDDGNVNGNDNGDDNDKNKDKKDGDVCSSPEVITLQQSPETLCISSDDDADDTNKEKNKLNKKVETKFIVVFDKKNSDLEKQIKSQETKPIEVEKAVVKTPEPPEEGEIVDDDDDEEEEVIEKVLPNDDVKNGESTEEDNKDGEESDDTEEDEAEKEKSVEKPERILKEMDSEEHYEEKLDDVIDLNEEELDFDMKDTSDVQKVVENDNTSENIDDSNDVVTIDLEESEPESDAVDETMNEEPDNESPDKTKMDWSSRWLGSKKVTKILATSRLGNRLRDKIKLKLKANNSSNSATNVTKEIKQQPSITIDQNYEEGSIQHYEELNKNRGDLNREEATKPAVDANNEKDDVINVKK